MTRLMIVLIGLLISFSALAQKSKASLSPTTFDFGTVEKWKNPPATFTVTNNGKEAFLFLPTFPKNDVYVQLPSEKIQPGETAIINVFYYTQTPGPFSKKIETYISTEAKPISFTVKGNIASFAENALLACPTMKPKSAEDLQFEQEILVIDKETREPIPLAEVKLTATNYKKKFKTLSNGIVSEPLNIDIYGIKVSKDGYETVSESVYINRMTGLITVELESIEGSEPILASAEPELVDEIEAIEEDEPEIVEEEEETMEFIDIEELEEEVPENTPANTASIEEDIEAIEPESPTAELPRTKYQPNNVVFLIDVSSSMKNPYKLPLLKESMKELLLLLRDIDYITVVTYAIHANVAVPTATANHKTEISAAIDSLEPWGYTSGVKGLEAAYASAREHYLPNGNNQVIIATDGLFNSPKFDKDAMFDLVKENAKNDIQLSVIGFGSDDEAIKMMKKLAGRGDGNFIKMGRESADSNLLIEEIKSNSQVQ